MILSKKSLPVIISTLLATASSYALKAPFPLDCMNVNVENGSVWSETTPWTAGSISIINNCGKDVDLRDAQLKLVGATSYESAHISSSPTGLAWPAYSVSTSDDNANKVTTFVFNKFENGNEWWKPNTNMAPGAELTFSLNPIQGALFKSSAFYPSGEAPITDKGSISFNTAEGSDTIPTGTKITVTGKDTGFSTKVDFSNGLRLKDIPYGEYNISANATIDGKSVEITLIPATLTLSKDNSSANILASYQKQTAQLSIQFSKSKPADVSQDTVSVKLLNDSTKSTTIKEIKWNDLAKLELQKNTDYKISASPTVGTQFQYNFNFDGQSVSNINISGNQKTVQMSYTQESIPTGTAKITVSNLDGNNVGVHFTGEDKLTHTVTVSDTSNPYDLRLPSGQSYAVTANTFNHDGFKYSLKPQNISIQDDKTTLVDLPFNKSAHIDEGKMFGYLTSWNKQLKISEAAEKGYEIVILAFAEVNGENVSMVDPWNIYINWQEEDAQDKWGIHMKEDIETAKASGKLKHVILSVGGQNNTFVPGQADKKIVAKNIVDYARSIGADGIDFDLEHLGAINPEEFEVYLSEIIKEIKNYDSNFIITAAPQFNLVNETDVNLVNTGVEQIYNRSISEGVYDYIFVQEYNTGHYYMDEMGKGYLEGNKPYGSVNQTDPKFIVNSYERLKQIIPSSTKIVPGQPSDKSAAGLATVYNGIYSETVYTELCKAYQTGSVYNDAQFGGAMTWSINQDAANNFKFVNSIFSSDCNTVEN